jgi:hypothetical protein
MGRRNFFDAKESSSVECGMLSRDAAGLCKCRRRRQRIRLGHSESRRGEWSRWVDFSFCLTHAVDFNLASRVVTCC